MSLSTSLNKYKKAKEVFERPINYDSLTARVAEGYKNRAKDEMEEALMEYRLKLNSLALPLVFLGKEAENLASMAEEDFGGFKVNLDTLADLVSSKMEEATYMNKSTNSYILELVNNIISQEMIEAGVREIPMLMLESKFMKTLNSKEDLEDFINEAILTLGAELYVIKAVSDLTKDCVEGEFENKVLPLYFFSKKETLAQEVAQAFKTFNKRSFSLALKTKNGPKADFFVKKADKESLETALNEIKNKL
jgi:hypothetical protein